MQRAPQPFRRETQPKHVRLVCLLERHLEACGLAPALPHRPPCTPPLCRSSGHTTADGHRTGRCGSNDAPQPEAERKAFGGDCLQAWARICRPERPGGRLFPWRLEARASARPVAHPHVDQERDPQIAPARKCRPESLGRPVQPSAVKAEVATRTRGDEAHGVVRRDRRTSDTAGGS
eukprot:scaffold21283_cov107-Isochrysis_galbana.AAC.2